MNISELYKSDAKRVLLEAALSPVQGDRFQPTGFADIGAGTYELPDGTRMLLVESAQSMANRLEATVLNENGDLIPELAGLPYVKVHLINGTDIETTSLAEPHRINSPFIIKDKHFQNEFKKLSGYEKGKPLDWRKIAKAIFYFDPNSILHGVFLSNLEDGRIKMPRMLTSFIEARNVREVVTGGVKNNPFDPSGQLRVDGFDKEVYSNVPFQRVEFTAESMKAFFNLDLGLLRGYGFSEVAFNLLVNLSFLKIRLFLEGGLRLRTACDLKLNGDLHVESPKGLLIPSVKDLKEAVKNGIQACKELFASPAVTKITTKVKWKTKKEDAADSAADETQE